VASVELRYLCAIMAKHYRRGRGKEAGLAQSFAGASGSPLTGQGDTKLCRAIRAPGTIYAQSVSAKEIHTALFISHSLSMHTTIQCYDS
jgi:hypothetical protein